MSARPSTSRSTAHMLEGRDAIRVPEVWPELSTGRLLTLDWLDGRKLLEHKDDPLAVRNRLATAMFTAWWFPFSRFGVIHGDPHLGNYTVFDDAQGRAGRHQPARLRLHPHLPAELRRRRGRSLSRPAATATTTLVVHAYETWGFKRLNRELIDALNIWARFIYGPLLDDRVRTIADGVKPSEYGRKEAFRVHQALKAKGPGDGAARIRVHGPRRDRPRRACSCTWRRSSISTDCSTRRSRISRSTRVAARQAPRWRRARPAGRPRQSAEAARGVALAGRNCANPLPPAF